MDAMLKHASRAGKRTRGERDSEYGHMMKSAFFFYLARPVLQIAMAGSRDLMTEQGCAHVFETIRERRLQTEKATSLAQQEPRTPTSSTSSLKMFFRLGGGGTPF
jgi:hypothetical protein